MNTKQQNTSSSSHHQNAMPVIQASKRIFKLKTLSMSKELEDQQILDQTTSEDGNSELGCVVADKILRRKKLMREQRLRCRQSDKKKINIASVFKHLNSQEKINEKDSVFSSDDEDDSISIASLDSRYSQISNHFNSNKISDFSINVAPQGKQEAVKELFTAPMHTETTQDESPNSQKNIQFFNEEEQRIVKILQCFAFKKVESVAWDSQEKEVMFNLMMLDPESDDFQNVRVSKKIIMKADPLLLVYAYEESKILDGIDGAELKKLKVLNM